MKIKLLLIALAATLQTLAAVPLSWPVETSRVQPAQFDCYQGETLALEAVLTSHGKPFNPGLSAAQIYWQTNGMGTVYWSASAAVSSNVLSAVWSPTNDVGARVYNCFLGASGSIYRAAFQLRMHPSPGATPSVLPLPTPTIDFARVTVLNPPWPSIETVPPMVSNIVTRQYVENLGIAAGLTTNDVAAIAYAAIETNATVIAATNAIEANAANIASNAAEIAAIPRIVESNENEGWAENAEYSETTIYAASAQWADIADEARAVVSSDGKDSYSAEFIGEVSTAAYNAQSLADYNAAAIAAETTAREAGDEQVLADATAYTDATASDLAPASLTNTVNAWTSYWSGDDVRVVVTNFFGGDDLPELSIEAKTNSTHRTIWRETDRLKPIAGAVVSNAADIAALDAAKADRNWGVYDSATGDWAPPDVASVGQRSVMLGAGSGYVPFVSASGGEVWVLTANEPQTMTLDDAGKLTIASADGLPMIEIVKGDKRTVPATCGGVTNDTTAGKFIVVYNVISSEHPTIEVCTNLTDASWIAEGSTAFPCAVTWSGRSGAWRCDLTTANLPRLFVRGSYEIGGESYLKLMGQRYTPGIAAESDPIALPRIAAETARAIAAEAAAEAAAKAYTDSVLGPISTALDAILGGH